MADWSRVQGAERNQGEARDVRRLSSHGQRTTTVQYSTVVISRCLRFPPFCFGIMEKLQAEDGLERNRSKRGGGEGRPLGVVETRRVFLATVRYYCCWRVIAVWLGDYACIHWPSRCSSCVYLRCQAWPLFVWFYLLRSMGILCKLFCWRVAGVWLLLLGEPFVE